MSPGTIAGIVAAELTYQVVRTSGVLTVTKVAIRGYKIVNTVAQIYSRSEDSVDEIFSDAIDAIRDAY